MLDSIIHDEKIIQLVIPDLTRRGENIFSVVVGKNGVGKSRLLRDIASNLMQNVDSFGSETKRVIAISTSPFDKFRTEIKAHKWLYSQTPEYYYVGMKSGGGLSRSPSISLISSASGGILDNFISSNKNVNLAKVFEVLGFYPEVTIALKLNNKKYFDGGDALRKMSFDKVPVGHDAYAIHYEDNETVLRNLISDLSEAGATPSNKAIEKLKNLSREELSNVFYHLSNVRALFSSDRPFFINLNFTEGIATLPRDSEFESNFRDFFDKIHNEDRYFYKKTTAFSKEILNSISALIDYDLIQINDIKLRKVATDVMSLRRASSGEQCMMVIMLGVAGHISDDSCILIDEPEISFHPEWQEKFMSLLIDAFSDYKNCHFIIATHSPQIVSKLNRENCFVTSLSSGEIYYSDFFSHRSADFQLAEIFESPGYRNEYIMRIALNLMANLRLNKKLQNSDMNDLYHLMQLKKHMDYDDPVIKIIDSVREAVSFYENI